MKKNLIIILLILFSHESKTQTVYFSSNYPHVITLISDAINQSFLISGKTNLYSSFISRMDNKGQFINSTVLKDSILPRNLFRLTDTKNVLFAYNLICDSAYLVSLFPDGTIAWKQAKPIDKFTNAPQNSISTSNAELNILFSNNFDVMLERLDSNGNQIGLIKVNNVKASIATNIRKYSKDRFLFTSKDTNSYYSSEHTVESINCIDTLGNLIWQKQFTHDSSYAGFYDIKILGNYIYPIYYLRDSITFKERQICYKMDILGNIINSKELIEPSQAYGSEMPSAYIESRKKDAFYFFVNYYPNAPNYLSYTELKKVDSDLNIKWTLRFNTVLKAIGLGNCNSILCAFEENHVNESVIQDIKDPELPEVCAHCGISVYPNPSSDLIYLSSQFKDVLIKGVSIWDLQGKNVLEYNLDVPVSNHLLTNQLVSGMYISEIKCDNGMKVYKKIFIN